ncbi:MAG: hypothetical protein LBT04_04775 [Prevotellaceae bacterium]|jgi:hypothetical protein|nr:hypothetical protein [Prevotellaceae bacterium]
MKTISILGSYLLICLLYSVVGHFILGMQFRFYYVVTLAGITVFCYLYKSASDEPDITFSEPVIKIICVVCIGYFVVYGVYQTFTAINMSKEMRSSAYQGQMNGKKMYTYIEDTDTWTDLFIPFGMAAKSPEEVGYIVVVSSVGKSLRGRWTSGSEEYIYYYNVTVTELNTGSRIINERFYSNYHDASLSRWDTEYAEGLEDYLNDRIADKRGTPHRIWNALLGCVPIPR